MHFAVFPFYPFFFNYVPLWPVGVRCDFDLRVNIVVGSEMENGGLHFSGFMLFSLRERLEGMFIYHQYP